MTIPAMAPPERPEWLPEAAAAVPVDDDDTVAVVVNIGGIDVVVGSWTFEQRDSA